MVSPDQNWAVEGIRRTCAGYVLRLLKATQDESGKRQWSLSTTMPVIEARTGPSGACKNATTWSANENGGWTALGWRANQVVVNRASELMLVSTDTSPSNLGDRTALSASTSSQIAANGLRVAYLSDWGIVLDDRSAASATLFNVGADIDKSAAIALSPSGNRIAFVQRGSIRWFDVRIGAGQPTAPPQP